MPDRSVSLFWRARPRSGAVHRDKMGKSFMLWVAAECYFSVARGFEVRPRAGSDLLVIAIPATVGASSIYPTSAPSGG
jgi:hypothetical protein